ncbi:MAG: hypothetical protein HC895_02975 [Leptolyngbyaceae cyanobacterium SM1_3_5]|nr:hypothetical protein [Leptolyngbyaceae cyanobacterium SM1_3_5]
MTHLPGVFTVLALWDALRFEGAVLRGVLEVLFVAAVAVAAAEVVLLRSPTTATS